MQPAMVRLLVIVACFAGIARARLVGQFLHGKGIFDAQRHRSAEQIASLIKGDPNMELYHKKWQDSKTSMDFIDYLASKDGPPSHILDAAAEDYLAKVGVGEALEDRPQYIALASATDAAKAAGEAGASEKRAKQMSRRIAKEQKQATDADKAAAEAGASEKRAKQMSRRIATEQTEATHAQNTAVEAAASEKRAKQMSRRIAKEQKEATDADKAAVEAGASETVEKVSRRMEQKDELMKQIVRRITKKQQEDKELEQMFEDDAKRKAHASEAMRQALGAAGKQLDKAAYTPY